MTHTGAAKRALFWRGRTLHPLTLALLLCAGLADAQSRAAAPRLAASRPTVVELYTSEGCSSCPPAEAQIGRLAQQNDIIALAFHVDYWDDLGWRDRFGLPEAVTRQRQYAHTLHLPSVYTPQLVIDGQRDLVGGGGDGAIAASAAAGTGGGGRNPGVALALAVQNDSLMVTLGAQPQQSACDVLLVGYLPQASSRVTRGENAGRELHEFNIVRSVRTLGSWKGEERSFNVPLTSLAPDATGVVVLVQQHDQGPIVGAATRLLR
jgi:hypothetical protein